MKQTIIIHSPFIRLDQFLKYAGICLSGAQAKQIILEGLVEVNHAVCLQRGKKLINGDLVAVNEKFQYMVKNEAD